MHVVLIEPQIPQNTGSIARTCAATDCELHLVGNLGFDISEKAVRRAGLDYWPHVKLHRHMSWEEFLSKHSQRKIWYFSKFGETIYHQATFSNEDALVFGCETKGLGEGFLGKCPSESILRIPISNEHVRSLNLSNAVSVAIYEALRQIDGQ